MAKSRRTTEKPLWQVGRKTGRDKPQGNSVVLRGPDGKTATLKGRHAERYMQQLAEQDKRKKAGQLPPDHGLAAAVPWRFRFHLVPGLWAMVMLSGLAAHAWHIRAWLFIALPVVVLTVLATHGAKPFPRVVSQLSALVSSLWAVLLSVTWLGKPWPALALGSWLVLAWLWIDHYRWRLPGPDTPAPDTSVQDRFAQLAAKRQWAAWLGTGKTVPGGMVYPIQCNGVQTDIGQVVSQPKAIAAAFSSTVAQVYAEEHPMGLQDQGELFMLRKATLEDIVRWTGAGVDPRTGLARIGRWPDGKIVYEQVMSFPEDGAKHCMVAGADGSGKSALLNLGIANSAVTGWIAPIILDPQNGQALPAWRHYVPYARGVTECMIWLKALWEAMQDRSDYLADLEWISPEDGDRRPGMGFFNPFIKIVDPVTGLIRPLGLPVIEITIDEASILLAEPGAKELILNLIKLGRKAGVRIRLATQVPSLSELKAQEIRSLLIGGGAFCLRTGDKVSAHMMNITAAPWELPKKFLNGKRTHGLGYASTLENRPNTPFRADWLKDPWAVAKSEGIAKPDDRFAAKMAEIISAENANADQLRQAADSQATLQLIILSLLPKTKGQLIQQFNGQLSLTDINSAVDSLISTGRATRRGDLIEAS